MDITHKLIITTSILALSACQTLDPTSQNLNNFDVVYDGGGKLTPILYKGNPTDANEGRLNFYARSVCRSVNYEDKLRGVQGTNIEFGSAAAIKGAGLLIDGLSNILTNAGQDRLEETPVTSSFIYAQNVEPVCIEISKNSDKRGKFVMEFGVQHHKETGAVRFIPLYLNYAQSSQTYWLNGGDRTLAVKFALQAADAQTPTEFTLNLGDWQPGSEAYFNVGAFRTATEDNINLAGPWMIISDNGKAKAMNVTATILETTSGNQIAKLLGEELVENRTKIDEKVKQAFTPAPLINTSELDEFYKNWGESYCVQAWPLATRLETNGLYEAPEWNKLKSTLRQVKTAYNVYPSGVNEGFYTEHSTLNYDAQISSEEWKEHAKSLKQS